jgi:predicted DNA-binding transcriptional regulator AlpA
MKFAEAQPPQLRRFIRLAEVMRITGLRHAAIYSKMSRGHFPRQVSLSVNPRAKKDSVAWLEDEIIAWQEARIAARDAKPLPKPYRERRPDNTPPAAAAAAAAAAAE